MVQDLATQWIQSYPCKTKTQQQTENSAIKFLEPSQEPKVIYTDNSLEFRKSCEDLSWNHWTPTPHRSWTDGIAERAVRRVKERAWTVLLQSGLDEKWWADSMECYCYLRKVEHLLVDGENSLWKTLRRIFQRSVPFGAMVKYHPTSIRDHSRLQQFGKKVLPGIFLGCALIAEGIRKGEILIVDLEELETMNASEVHPRMINAKEVLILQKGEEVIFPEDGAAKLFGRDYEFREFTLRCKQTVRSEGLSGEAPGESEESQPTEPKDDAEARRNSWPYHGDFTLSSSQWT